MLYHLILHFSFLYLSSEDSIKDDNLDDFEQLNSLPNGSRRHACLYPNPQVSLPTLPQEEGKIDCKREKSASPKLNIKGGDATRIRRTIHEWLQRTSTALNTWKCFSGTMLSPLQNQLTTNGP